MLNATDISSADLAPVATACATASVSVCCSTIALLFSCRVVAGDAGDLHVPSDLSCLTARGDALDAPAFFPFSSVVTLQSTLVYTSFLHLSAVFYPIAEAYQ